MAGGSRWVGVVVAAALVAGCSGEDSSPPTTSAPAADLSTSLPPATDPPSAALGTDGTAPPAIIETPATPEPTTTEPALSAGEAASVLDSVNIADPASVHALEFIKSDPVTVEHAAALLLDRSALSADVLWAVVYVLGNADGHASDLEPLVTDGDVTIRLFASIGAVGQGSAAGFPTLVELLTNDELTRGLEPPMFAWQLAALTLARSTALTLGPAFDADPADRRAGQHRWTEWLAANPTLTFDPASEQWSPG